MENKLNSPDRAQKLVVLIDADNASADDIEKVLAEVARYGTANVKRIYGNWTNNKLGKWKKALLEHSLQPRQQFNYTDGKNATDIAMVIEAMDLLHTGNFHGFCLVTSDCDFTPLAVRIREQGLEVYGFGEKEKAPDAFIKSCNKFIYTESLHAAGTKAPSKKLVIPQNELQKDIVLLNLLNNATDASSEDDGWSYLGEVGSYIAKHSTDFDPRNYGYKKLGELVIATGLFDNVNRAKEGFSSAIYIRFKQ